MKIVKVKYKANKATITEVHSSIGAFMKNYSDKGYHNLVSFLGVAQLYYRLTKTLLITKNSYVISIPVLEACAYCYFYEKGKMPVLDAMSEIAVRELYTLIDKQVK